MTVVQSMERRGGGGGFSADTRLQLELRLRTLLEQWKVGQKNQSEVVTEVMGWVDPTGGGGGGDLHKQPIEQELLPARRSLSSLQSNNTDLSAIPILTAFYSLFHSFCIYPVVWTARLFKRGFYLLVCFAVLLAFFTVIMKTLIFFFG
jgi:hypothetical protein